MRVPFFGFFAAPGMKSDKIQEFHQLLEQMYERDEWKKIRTSRGWNDLYVKGEKFKQFLQKQETELGILLKELGFLDKSMALTGDKK